MREINFVNSQKHIALLTSYILAAGDHWFWETPDKSVKFENGEEQKSYSLCLTGEVSANQWIN